MIKNCLKYILLLFLIFHNAYGQAPPGFSLIAYEGFDYPNNTDIANQSGGSGWSGNWEAGFYGGSTMIVNSPGLSYTGLNVKGNKLEWGGPGQYQPHSVRRAINNPNSGIVYIQFMSDFNSTSGGTDRLDLNLAGITLASFGGNNSQQKMSILAGGLIINSTYSVFDLSLVIIQIDYTNNTTKMWVKPTLSTFDYSNPGTPNAVYNNSIAFDQISLAFRSGGQIDEIAVFNKKTFLTSNGKIANSGSSHLTKYGSLVTSEKNGSINSNGKISITAPDAPIIGTAIASSTQTSVSFTTPLSDGDSPITFYTAIASPGGNIGTVSQSGSGTIIVPNLINGIAYTFTVTATNAGGTSASSSPSNQVTHIVPAVSRTLSFEFGGDQLPQPLYGSTWSSPGGAYSNVDSNYYYTGQYGCSVYFFSSYDSFVLENSFDFNANSIRVFNQGYGTSTSITINGYDSSNTLVGSVTSSVPISNSWPPDFILVNINLNGIRRLEIFANVDPGPGGIEGFNFDDLIYEQ